ncbi:MAG: serine hydrolase domain-containing protein [Vicinamibacterales bacterium]|jgi:CubicO group peptidase (beta-lactamase class C family)|nr:serine hydrolase domain-containing protein [Vicinamibacterales bacterium]MDP7472264.1 serine hydrolase domain-containing protein [Vicinamibacterales bacterium]MDP7670786.1 serine hydrolase domain-containing protein [Vicinamibacterales bacterium]HJO37793.1 serine hydrolase domain-containing protein [Vicinamibacterales bacterium]
MRSVVSVHRLRPVVALVGLILATTVSAQEAPDQGAILDALGEIRRAAGVPGVTAAVAVDGEAIFSGGTGWADLENQAPSAGVTVHNVASISKAMTTVAILQLVEQEVLGLDDRIREHLPALPASVDRVTVRQIMTHTSGLRESYELPLRTVDALVAAIGDAGADALRFAPGEFWSYSSAGFNLLQAVIESVSGLDFELYMRTRIWQPAEMSRTALDVPAQIVPRRGRGYGRDGDGNRINATFFDMPALWAAGGVLSTAGDLARLGVAINDGALLERSTVTLMHRAQVDPVMEFKVGGPPEERDFVQALGWWIDTDARGRRYVNHTGQIRGVSSILMNYLDDDLVIALVANILPFDARTHGEALAQIFFEQ